jgi:hypothetical protein
MQYVRFMTGQDIVSAQAWYNHPPQYRTPLSASVNFQMTNGATMTSSFVASGAENVILVLVYAKIEYLPRQVQDRGDKRGDHNVIFRRLRASAGSRALVYRPFYRRNSLRLWVRSCGGEWRGDLRRGSGQE